MKIMKRVFVLFLILFATQAFPAQNPPAGDVNNSFGQNEIKKKHLQILEKYLEQWIEESNRGARGVVIYKFDGFLDLPEDLQKKAYRAFPHQRFTVVALSIFHKAWFKENHYFLTDRRTGRILGFSPNPLMLERNAFEKFGVVLLGSQAKNKIDALFIAKTFAEIFLFGIKGSIGEIKSTPDGISVLLCQKLGIKDYGRTLIIKFRSGFRFERPYLDKDQWLPAQCPLNRRAKTVEILKALQVPHLTV